MDFDLYLQETCSPEAVLEVKAAEPSTNDSIRLLAQFGVAGWDRPVCNAAVVSYYMRNLTPLSDTRRMAAVFATAGELWSDLPEAAQTRMLELMKDAPLGDEALALVVFQTLLTVRVDIRDALAFAPDPVAKSVLPPDDATLHYYLYAWSVGDKDAPQELSAYLRSAKDAVQTANSLYLISSARLPSWLHVIQGFLSDTRRFEDMHGDSQTVSEVAREILSHN